MKDIFENIKDTLQELLNVGLAGICIIIAIYFWVAILGSV